MKKSLKISILLIILIALVSLLTMYYGSTDLNDYAGVAKFFAGDYPAKIRSSHSLLYGYLVSPLVKISHSFFFLKVLNLFFLILLSISLYYISNKNSRTLLLFLISPIVWYIAPWISPLLLSSLLFLWGFFFISKFEDNKNLLNLVFSGILIGLSLAFWNTVIFIIFFLLICFFYSRKVSHLFYFLLSVLAGFSPLLIFDKIFYDFAFYSTLKFLFGIATMSIYKSIYPGINQIASSFSSYLSFILLLPLFFYLLFSREVFSENRKQIIFLALSFLFFLVNPQPRYIFFLWPILILYLSPRLNEKQFKIQSAIFIVITLIVIAPYLIQINYSTNAKDFTSVISNFGNWKITDDTYELISQDLEEISKEYPNETFVVGNHPDVYTDLALAYWGGNIKEIVSIQDYDMYLKNQSVLFEKKFMSVPKIKDRRLIWIGGGLEKAPDDTDCNAINLGIGFREPIALQDFKILKKYRILYLSIRD